MITFRLSHSQVLLLLDVLYQYRLKAVDTEFDPQFAREHIRAIDELVGLLMRAAQAND
jgi:hypothetical protein